MVPISLLDKIQMMRPEVSRGSASDQHNFGGERFLPGYSDGSLELQHIHRYAFALPFVVGKNVVDIACGEGYGSDLMAQVANRVVGIDIDGPVIDEANKRYSRPNLAFKVGAAAAIPLENNSTDVVVSFETLEHLFNQDSFWSEVKRLLKSNGMLILSSPNRDVYNQQRSLQNSFHVRELTRNELVAELSHHFKHHALFSQRTVLGSSIVPVVPEQAAALTMISLDSDTGVLGWTKGEDVRYPISIAIASDEPPDVPGESIYAGNYPPNAIASLVGGIAERDQTVCELRNQLATQEAGRPVSISGHIPGEVMNGADLHRPERAEVLKERDRALLQLDRVKETLDEQQQTIQALRALLDECMRRLTAVDKKPYRSEAEGGD